MGYNSTGLVVHDADAHIMEPPNWLRDHADPQIRDRIQPLTYPGGNELRQTGDPDEQRRDLERAFEGLRARHASPDYRAGRRAAQSRSSVNVAGSSREKPTTCWPSGVTS